MSVWPSLLTWHQQGQLVEIWAAGCVDFLEEGFLQYRFMQGGESQSCGHQACKNLAETILQHGLQD